MSAPPADPPTDPAAGQAEPRTPRTGVRRHAVVHQLRVARVDPLTDDAVAVTFEVPPELAEDYRFVPGQHLNVSTPRAGDDLRRSYSICSPWSPRPPARLRIGVKRVAGGGFSSYALTDLAPGDEVGVMTPTGRFTVVPDPAAARHLAFVAAGSGITPILSMVASVLAVEPASRVTLLYGNRTSASVMFVEELADLKDRCPDRFHLVHVLSRELPEIALLGGRLDAAKLGGFLDTLLPVESVEQWYLCGPLAMVEEIRGLLRERGVPRTRVHTELFHVGPPVEAAPVAAPPTTEAAPAGCEVEVVMDGRRSSFRLPVPGPPVLEGVLGVRGDAPFACRGGVCGTCRARVLEGGVRMDRCFALEPEEVARGYVLTCQARPTSDRLVVDYDA
ncbi:1,2-phenylacetyl-CoA epoxidase subunit PaaE [Actinopolymorpha singaporensis]|uniref:Ring-1,2-phenylacetyl-CoA epoxidase subunit PaaE n=1 Tax=Actinopolymorpha singaporensis TaxID=117157 RepID=A0A1H1XWF3_9ACTN|nr:1,2-phenylacetyl-CoA epoxidase subunit PaaE [Actinopolymorpha singaporensis]SDT13503.1 ring-1,2-phenylacetyl-CoA epoxidase subunit PaaE [Actinopolymorpha singaporensis]